MEEPTFLLLEQINQLHEESLRRHGGLDGLREPGLFDSALMQPEAAYFYGNGDLFAIAAAYAFHIAQNQPFLDGNKRTAVGAALAFLELNGIRVENYDWKQLYDGMIGIAEKRLDKAGLAEVFRSALTT